MKVVAFLQNMWVKEPARAVESMARYGRVPVIRRLLFMGCLTGRRLTAAFGGPSRTGGPMPDGRTLLDHIVFEETTLQVADNPRTIFPVDLDHIEAVLNEQKPVAILTFGAIAAKGVGRCWSGPAIHAPHPAARHKETVPRLKAAAAQLRDLLAMEEARQLAGLDETVVATGFGPTVANPTGATCASATEACLDFNAEAAETQRERR